MRPNWFIGFPVLDTDWFLKLESVPRGTRYCHEDDLHVTFSFLGPVEEEQAMSAWEAAKKLVGGPFEFELGRIRAFGPSREPTAWGVVPATTNHELVSFMVMHRNEVASAGNARPDSRSPQPHITVARPQRRAGADRRRNLADWAARQILPSETLILESLALYTWSDEHDDHLFKIVDTCDLLDPEVRAALDIEREAEADAD